jgi:hypothetical protein
MMLSWWNVLPKRPDETPTSDVVRYIESPAVTAGSTSANLVIHELTTKFTKEIKEKAGKLEITVWNRG